MGAIKLIAVTLIVAGILAVAYGGFTYTKRTHEARIGSINLSIKDTETVNVPMWAGVGVIVLGGVLLVLGQKK